MRELLPPIAVSASETVVERIAHHEGVDPVDLTPLYDAIDPDALDAIIDGAEQRNTPLDIEFTYHGYDVTVTSDGAVHVVRETGAR